MNQLLTVFLLAGMAMAQSVGSQFVAGGPVPPASTGPDLSVVNPVSSPVNALPDLLPKPVGKATLVGGTVSKVDRVRDEIVIKIFGGGSAHVLSDSRTHIYRDETAASLGDIQTGDRIYADTLLAGKDIFAQSIRVVTHGVAGRSVGQVVSYNQRSGELVVSDAIFPRKIALRVLPNTVISGDGGAVCVDQLVPGTLVSLNFQSGGGQPFAQQITVLAAPGSAFVFVGRVTHLDVHVGSLVLVDPRDQKSYEISFDPSVINVSNDLQEGATVEVTTQFNGRQYLASAIKVEPPVTP